MRRLLIVANILFMLLFSTTVAVASSDTKDFVPQEASDTKELIYGLNAYRVDGYWGIYNSKGIVVTPMYDDITPGSNYILVKQNGYYGALDKSGKVVVNAMYDSIQEVSAGWLILGQRGLFGWTDGYKTHMPSYRRVEYAGRNMFGVCDDNGCGVVNPSDVQIIPLTHKESFSFLTDGYFKLTYNGMIGIADIFGNNLINCICLDDVERADKNAIYVVNPLNKLKGLLRTYDGKRIAPTKYTNIVEIKEQPGYFKVKYNGKWGAIDYDGNNVFPPNYGPLEINGMIKDLPANRIYREQYDYNAQYQKLGKACFEYYGYKSLGFMTKRSMRELINNTSTNEKIKNMARTFIQMYNIVL